MNARQKVSLVSRLRKNNVPQNKIDQLFNLTENKLDKLYLIYNNELFMKEVAKLLGENKEKYGFYLDRLKDLKNQFSQEDYNEAVTLIKNSPYHFNARYIIIVLKTELLQKKNLQLVGARLVSNAKREINAEYALRILTISRLHDLNIAIPMAELIVGTENREECLNIIREVLNNEKTLNEVNGIIERLTANLRRTLINMPDYEEEATDLLNIFSEILNKPFINVPIKKDKMRIRRK